MGALFSKQKKSRVTEQDKAVLQLKQQRDKLKMYQKRIEATLEKDREMARKLLRDGKKDRVKLLLRKKKYQEQLLSTADGQLENIEKLSHDLEFAQIELQVVNGLKVGNEALKKVHEILNVEEIERILDNTREGVEKQREIDELLSGALSEQDEEDILEELDEITREEEKKSLPSVPSTEPPVAEAEPVSMEVDELPDVPTDEPKQVEKERVKEKKQTQKIALAAS